MESWLRPFALGVNSKFQLAPPLLSRAEGMQGARVIHGRWCQPGWCPGLGGRLGGPILTHISGWYNSVPEEPGFFDFFFFFFYFEYCTRAVKMLVRTQLSLEGSRFGMNVLICN